MCTEKRPFNGGFIKSQNYTCYKDLLESGFKVNYDKLLYEKIADEIEKVLGKKKSYTVTDAVYYFQSKYQAMRIPWEYALWYEECDYDILFDGSCEPSKDSMRPFDYSKVTGEQNIALMVDTIFNNRLRNEYPDIEKLEQERKAREQNKNKLPRCNPIIVIGFYNSNMINSMCRYNNYHLIDDVENPRESISDIDYEMWYFYKHS